MRTSRVQAINVEIVWPKPGPGVVGDYLVLLPGNAHPIFARVRMNVSDGNRMWMFTYVGADCMPMDRVPEESRWSRPIELQFAKGASHA